MLKTIQSHWIQKLRRWSALLRYSSAASESPGGDGFSQGSADAEHRNDDESDDSCDGSMGVLARVVVFSRSPAAMAAFFSTVAQLRLVPPRSRLAGLSGSIAEPTSAADGVDLIDAQGFLVSIRPATNEAMMSSGYSPMLAFAVADLSTAVQAALQHGAVLDGPISYRYFGKAAVLRSPEGTMLALYEADDEYDAVEKTIREGSL